MFKALHLFAGAGGGALGFQQAGFECVGAFDIDPVACEAYEYLTGEKAVCADLSTMTPQDLRAACTGRPEIVLTSPPCKSFSGCLPQAMADTDKYVDMSSLALRGIWLSVEAWDIPPPIICMENVPRITSRGAHWLEQLRGLLHSYGYAIDERTHDVGELGGLGQRRRRYLLMARHMKQCPVNIFLPPMQKLKSIGDVIGQLPVPLPNSGEGGPMHRLPRLSALNWVRLALIPAGGDWRDLPPAVAIVAGPHRHHGGYGVNDWEGPSKTVVAAADARQKPVSVSDPRLGHQAREGSMGVEDWDEEAHTVKGAHTVDNANGSVADPRLNHDAHRGTSGVVGWTDPGNTIKGAHTIRNTTAAVADPRLGTRDARQNGGFGVNDSEQPAHAVVAEGTVRNTWASVTDPRIECGAYSGGLGVNPSGEPARTVIAAGRVMSACQSVQDPRIATEQRSDSYGVAGFEDPAHAVLAHGRHDNSQGSVADPRVNAGANQHNGRLGVEGFDDAAHTVTGRLDARTTWGSVADPRSECQRRDGAMGITPWTVPSTPIIGHTEMHNGPWQTADPRIEGSPHRHNGKYGVQEWAKPSHAIISEARVGKGWAGVQDPRMPELVGPEIDLSSKRPVYLIICAADGTWHRPLTTLELAALQSLPVWHRGGWLVLPGNDGTRRQLIGNMIPPKAAKVIGSACAVALAAARDGRTFMLSSEDIWVDERREVGVQA